MKTLACEDYCEAIIKVGNLLLIKNPLALQLGNPLTERVASRRAASAGTTGELAATVSQI
jgi:hypothetical protein